MSKSKTADILERELEPTIKEWLRRVNLVPELTAIPLSDADRTGHLPKLYYDLISRLRLAKDAHRPVSAAAATHGQIRRAQGYSASMLIEESRVFQVATFGTLHLHQSELDQKQVLLDIMVIADEVDAQLME
ncbi:MAG: response regulator, partial [Halobacteriota archaeon]